MGQNIWSKQSREVEQPFFAHPICTTDQGPSSGLSTSLGTLKVCWTASIEGRSINLDPKADIDPEAFQSPDMTEQPVVCLPTPNLSVSAV